MDLKDNFILKWFKWFFNVRSDSKNVDKSKLINLEHERNSKRQFR
ncbi:hypothetical protein [Methanococcus maripaludis]|nr:hypothetical protein [Methanococcus maripaludis]